MSELMLFRTAKQKQGDRRRAERLRGKKRSKKNRLKQLAVGGGIFGTGIAGLKLYDIHKKKKAASLALDETMIKGKKYKVKNVQDEWNQANRWNRMFRK